MFSGIVDHTGTLLELETKPDSLHAVIKCQYDDIQEGESIAIDGICLTATQQQKHQFSCDISSETIKLTTAARFAKGKTVNVERSLRMGDRVGGHWVMGHVDQTAQIKHVQPQQEFTELTIAGLPSDAMSYIIRKGSIAVNGVSLTINEVLTDGFKLMLIPHTLERTNLKNLQAGDEVNLEFDWMTRVVISQLKELPLIK